eukprot:10964057-Ditylum_brightwellii.AAC.1
MTTILGTSLEIIIHELLYCRRIYPTESFTLQRYCGVQCHASRVPGVCEYVAETLSVAIPALCCGVADELALVVMCGGKTKEKNGRRRRRSLVDENVVAAEQVLERFVFQFSLNHTVDIIENSTSSSAAALSQEQDNHKKRQSSSEEDKAILSAAMRELERGMRDTLLS